MKRWATFVLSILILVMISNSVGQTSLRSFTGLQGRELRLFVSNALDSLTSNATGGCGSFYLYILGDTVLFAQLSDSTKKIDTTYAPFQAYVDAHAGAGSGDIDAVIAGAGMTGGATSGNATLNIVGRFGILAGADSLILDTAGIRTWLETLANTTASDSFFVKYGSWGVEGFVYTGDTLFIDTVGGSGGLDSAATIALVRDSVDALVSFYVAESTVTSTGVKHPGDTIFIDTSGGSGSVDSFYVAQGDTTVLGWKQSGDTIFIDTTGGVGGGMSIDSTTAGDGLLETANDIDVVPGFGVLIRNDSVHADFAELDDTLMRANKVRDTVNAMGIIDSTTGGNGLIESSNVLAVRPGFGIDTTNDLVKVDFADLDDTLPRYARIRDTAALMIEDSLDNYTLLSDFGKVTDDSTALIAAKDSVAAWDNGVLIRAAKVRDTVNAMGITDSSAAGNGLTETGNTINAVGRYGIIAGADSLIFDSATVRTWIASSFGFLTSETGDISSVVAGNGLTGGATSGAATVDLTTKWGLRSGADSVMAAVSDLDDSLTLLTDFAKVTDDTANFKIAYDSSQHDYLRSNEKAATAGVADSAKAVDTSYAPLRALKVAADSTTAYRTAFDPDYLKGDATDNDLVDSALLQGIQPSKIASGGALAGEVLTWSGTAYEPQPSGSFTNLEIHGDLLSFGSPRVVNHAERVDIQNMWASHKTTPLFIELPDTVKISSTDSTTVVHPSIIYVPGGWPAAKPYKYWMAMTYGNDAYEDGFLRVSNDGETWVRFFVGSDSCPDPIMAEDDADLGYHGVPSHLSDNDLIMGADAKLHFYIRSSDTLYPGGVTTWYNAIFHSESSDGITWSTPVKVIDWRATTVNQIMSPAFWVDTNATYKAWSINYKDSSFGGQIHKFSNITLWQSDSVNGIFDSVQQVVDSTTGFTWFRDTTLSGDRFGGLGRDGKKDSAVVWHIDALESGGDEKFALITASAPRGISSYYLLGGVSRDGGKSLVIRREPILADSAHDLSFGASAVHATTVDYNMIYKSTGYWVKTANGGYMDLFYGCNGPTAYRILRTRLEFLTTNSLDLQSIRGRQVAPTDSLVLTFGGFADSTTGVADAFVDSSGYGGVGVKNDYVYATFKADNDIALDSLIFRWMHTEAGTGSTARDSIRTDSLILYGPDLSSGTNACDSVWWVRGGPDSLNIGFPVHDSTLPGWSISSRTRTAIPLRLYQLAPAGSIFRLVMINRFNAARSAVHVEDIEIKGRSR